MGGEPADDFVRIWVDHIARQYKDEEMKGQFWVAVNKVLKPFISDRGLRWEMHVDEDTVQPVDQRASARHCPTRRPSRNGGPRTRHPPTSQARKIRKRSFATTAFQTASPAARLGLTPRCQKIHV